MRKIPLLIASILLILTCIPLYSIVIAENNSNQNVQIAANSASDVLVGTIKWFDQQNGFGFIIPQTGGEVFVHFTAIVPMPDGTPRILYGGQVVQFRMINGENGPQATWVAAIDSN